jgi:hypothetical protein
MRNILVVRGEWEKAQAAYASAVKSQPESAWRPLHERVVALGKELSRTIAADAVPCSRCGGAPTGLRHVRGDLPRLGKPTYRHVYEIGCTVCQDTDKDDRRGMSETPRMGSGAELDKLAEKTAKEAVADWNEKNAPPVGKDAPRES